MKREMKERERERAGSSEKVDRSRLNFFVSARSFPAPKKNPLFFRSNHQSTHPAATREDTRARISKQRAARSAGERRPRREERRGRRGIGKKEKENDLKLLSLFSPASPRAKPGATTPIWKQVEIEEEIEKAPL